MNAAAVLAERLGLRKRPRSWSGTCPACDHSRAFPVHPGEGGGKRVRAFCANGCTFDRLSDALVRVAGAAGHPVARRRTFGRRSRPAASNAGWCCHRGCAGW